LDKSVGYIFLNVGEKDAALVLGDLLVDELREASSPGLERMPGVLPNLLNKINNKFIFNFIG
jgi:hypothetical protein